ncbi:zinc finger CCCH-type antiviral protein 1-like isoform X2 [Empidonax traillii]|uniref:zinc finger CCCH-type antiviral protein 1-like isoform X2 n=1 Tax=Empidonax traillii TaxID=164674 RepID=UPI000FFCFFCE|nr:zinc finger CCCH-type antiviral protein 1-like isoform X2 [Empidonax traillii]
MSDPAVCCFLTRALCAQGGRLGLPELQQHAGLSAPQLAETLAAAGPRRFLMLRGGAEVLAVSDVRVCPRKECDGGCERLHLCKQNLMGKCHLGPSSCKYSHDITNAENKKVLKKHDLSGLSENELRILLLQNDTFFLPDGECRFLTCMRSHNLLDGHALRVLETGGIDRKTASNLQIIYDYKHMEFHRELMKGNVHNYKPRGNYLKKPVVTTSKEPKVPLQTVDSTLRVPSPEGPGSTPAGQRQHQLPPGAVGKDEDKKDDSSAEASKDNKEVNCDEICVFYVWKYCKHKDKCKSVHYHLPYKWEMYDGIIWNDLSMMEEIEKAYCDPKNSSMADRNINFQTMTCYSSPVRRLSTPSSVTKPTFVLTTQWIWYWKNNQDQWIEYGEQGEGDSVDSPSSAVLENLYQADPDATISFQAGQHHYNLNFKEMIQTNIAFKTQRQVCRRPKFVSSEDVQKIKKGQRDSSIPNQACPSHWDQSALPDLGYKAVEISSVTSEYNTIKQLFHQTMKTYSILKIQRIQNPSLWKVFQWQKEKMKRENGGKEVQEKLLFHGTNTTSMEAICTQNFDWRICGKNGTNYGMGSYFARDASYSHAYCQATEKGNMMFVARVLVGDYIKGNAAYVRPPKKSVDGLWFYDSCVDDELNPSVFVIFEKHQIYPEYIIEYKEDQRRCVIS